MVLLFVTRGHGGRHEPVSTEKDPLLWSPRYNKTHAREMRDWWEEQRGRGQAGSIPGRDRVEEAGDKGARNGGRQIQNKGNRSKQGRRCRRTEGGRGGFIPSHNPVLPLSVPSIHSGAGDVLELYLKIYSCDPFDKEISKEGRLSGGDLRLCMLCCYWRTLHGSGQLKSRQQLVATETPL